MSLFSKRDWNTRMALGMICISLFVHTMLATLLFMKQDWAMTAWFGILGLLTIGALLPSWRDRV